MFEEIWREVPEFPEYEISSRGELRRYGRLKTAFISKGGYRRFSLCCNNKKIKKNAARLVAAAFIGPCPKGHHVHHRNGKQADDYYLNLQYLPAKDHCKMNKVPAFKGEDQPNAKLSSADVMQIREFYRAGGQSYTQLAQIFGVDFSTIGRIIRGVDWKHLPCEEGIRP